MFKLKPPSGRLTWWAALFFLCGVSLAVEGLLRSAPIPTILALLSLCVAAGCWLQKAWARRGGLVLSVVLGLGGLLELALFAFHFPAVVRLVVAPLLGWGVWKFLKSAGDEDQPMISLVLLLREPRFVDAAILARLASEAWGSSIVAGDEGCDDCESFVIGESPIFMLQDQKLLFLVHNIDHPYVENPDEAAQEIPELRMRKALAEHRAWLAVDLMGSDQAEQAAEGYRRIGRLLAELADDDCLAIYCPASGRLVVYDSSLEDKLRGPSPLEDLIDSPFAPVMAVESDDPRMRAAVEEARRRWPEFVSAFEQRRGEQHFAAKVPFQNGENTEFMWLTVTAIEGEAIYGTLDNDPVDVRSVKLGDRVRVLISELNDWVYTEGDQLNGGFTIKIFENLE